MRSPGDAIFDTLQTPNEYDTNDENANVVDGLFFIGRAINRLANVVELATSHGIEGQPSDTVIAQAMRDYVDHVIGQSDE